MGSMQLKASLIQLSSTFVSSSTPLEIVHGGCLSAWNSPYPLQKVQPVCRCMCDAVYQQSCPWAIVLGVTMNCIISFTVLLPTCHPADSVVPEVHRSVNYYTPRCEIKDLRNIDI